MTTKTDYNSVRELQDYVPENLNFVLPDEVERIRAALEVGSRNEIELQNVRDMAVILFGQWSDDMRRREGRCEGAEAEEAGRKYDQYRAAMSAICCVIDQEKLSRGIEM